MPDMSQSPETPFDADRTRDLGVPDDTTTPLAAGSDPTRPPRPAPAPDTPAAAAASAVSAVSAARPEQVGEYHVVGELGRGGMGVVYVAEDPRLKRRIAIKVLPVAVAADPEWLARFEREAQLLAALNHPNIATIHSLEAAGSLRFLTLELIPGEDLSARIARGPLGIDEALTLCRQIAAALEVAHKRGVVHLDIKPGNVRITPDGLVKVLDFGLARAVAAEPADGAASAGAAGAGAASAGAASAGAAGAAESGSIIGSPGYMSPEQMRGEPLDHRTDLWALGCILYECLTGRRAFRGASIKEICAATFHQDPDWQALPAELPPVLHATLRRTLAKQAADRPAAAAELRRALEEAIQERTLRALTAARREERVAAPNNLPVAVTSFVGRRSEQAAIKELLAATRLLTLSGIGGCGKTRLSLEVAREIIAEYADGAWLVELAPLANAELVPQAVAHGLGLKEEPHQPTIETLVAHLKPRSMLLLLDNCEHLLGACADLVAILLRSCPGLRIIATSREGLGIPGESIFHVPPLAVPTGRSFSPEELGQVESVQLFVERARVVNATFTLNAATFAPVREICRHLDGIPLAIELAVARIKVMSAAEIASHLDDRFRLLTGGSRTALPHHQTLRALIDWSYESLTPHEAAVFRRLSFFAGGWTLDSAGAVCAGDDLEEWEVLDLLSRLVDKSLVEIDAEGGQRTGKTRYRMLETVRSYARQRLGEQGESDGTRERHLAHFLSWAEAADRQLTGEEQGLWLSRIEAEHDNLRLAVDTCRSADHDATCGLRLAGALGRFWEVHGHWSEGRGVCAEMIARPGPGDPAARAKVLVCAGNLALSQGDGVEARRAYEESLAIRRRLGDKPGIAQSLNSLGLIAWTRGAFDESRQLYEESLAVRRELGDERGIALSLNNLANLARDQGEHDEARRLHEESLSIKRRLGDRRGIASSLNNLGVVLRRLGDYRRARTCYEESLGIRREIGDKQGIAQSLNSLGNLAEEEGEHAEARALHVESLAIKRELGDRRGTVVSLVNIANVLRRQGEFAGARLLLEESLDLERESDSPKRIAVLLHMLGVVCEKQGDHAVARSFLTESLTIRHEIGDRSGVAEALESLALLATATGEGERAAFLLGAADAHGGGASVEVAATSSERTTSEAALRAALGDELYARKWDEGQKAPLEAAVRFALGALGPF